MIIQGSFYSRNDQIMINRLKRQTRKGNLDNISRTVCYQQFYKKHPEIKWAYLASMVSRNAGWNMTDLASQVYERMIPTHYRKFLFMTYERANWLIFDDAYPQLLIYEASKQQQQPLFHLLKAFHVSNFMIHEWMIFWRKKDQDRLCTALIINEQHLIQKPVIEHPFYQKKVFKTFPFYLEELLHFSVVLLPSRNGQLFGFSVHGFQKVKNRILLGRRLAWVLFNSPAQNQIRDFSLKVQHTGSRSDYERYLVTKPPKKTPMLRSTYPVIYHERRQGHDWFSQKTNRYVDKYFANFTVPRKYELTKWYENKQKQLYVSMRLEELLLPKNVWDYIKLTKK
ncbi:DUF2515 domain-containing protein [Desertibacillus haloalkaliphilus]|uniref:DUF2515 domain-containing protein n=1 Tax=Desertibacillus haloalkaliphilus TaxID=1328930 RepID=UPI001C27E9AB|nr:DUF2515 domain-containing protein [Desertibacillus haloalkaliphilus]MBU8907294.1 DUF2515 domain-containing protein [Desertibacillus haloalkaliphilus]